MAAGILAVLVIVGGVLAVALTRDEASPSSGTDTDGADSSSAPETPSTFTVSGTLSLTDEDMQNPSFDRILNRCNFDAKCSQPAGEPCAAGSSGYADISAGAQVRVTDGDGTVIAIGALGDGVTPHTPDVWAGNDWYPPCLFPFEVEDVPVSGEIYGVEVSSRGVLQFTESEAQSLAFSLGD